MKKSVLTFLLYLSKINDQVYVAMDGNLIDFNDFGIDADKYKEMCDAIEKTVQDILRK